MERVEALKKCFNIKEEGEAHNSHRYSKAMHSGVATLPDWPARLADWSGDSARLACLADRLAL
jgi:hypothetical protein